MSVSMVKRQHRARQDPLAKIHRPGDERITEGWVHVRSGVAHPEVRIMCHAV